MTTPDPTAGPPAPPSGPPPGPPSGAPPGTGPGTPSGAPPYGSTYAGQPFAGQPFSAPSPQDAAMPTGMVLGIILVVVGCVFLALRVADISLGSHAWPLWIVVPGLAMLLGSLGIPPRNGLGLAVPGAILATVGLILWVQDVYGLYGTWAYAWALVAPTAPGVAMLLYGGVRGDRALAADGLRASLTGIGLFLGFGLFFEGVIGISGHRLENLDQVLPYAVIALGVLLVLLSMLGGGSRRDARREARHERREARRASRQR
jgi:hypothetical protein